ncbi:MAG: hypothetical protein QOI01_555 [Mycobacterium sp.]|nr:hypothetical protein [Mycobacterium sp.]
MSVMCTCPKPGTTAMSKAKRSTKVPNMGLNRSTASVNECFLGWDLDVGNEFDLLQQTDWADTAPVWVSRSPVCALRRSASNPLAGFWAGPVRLSRGLSRKK